MFQDPGASGQEVSAEDEELLLLQDDEEDWVDRRRVESFFDISFASLEILHVVLNIDLYH